MKNVHATVFVGGDAPDEHVIGNLDRDSLTIAADSGWSHAVSLGVVPDLLVGDMDSITPDHLRAAHDHHVEIIEFPVEKDATDTEIALRAATERGATRITVVSGGGNRFDHILAMVHSLAAVDAEVTAYIGQARIEFVTPHRGLSFICESGTLVSLIPIGGDALGVSTTGLKWDLHHETLHVLESRGISNVATDPHVKIAVAQGHVAVVRPDFLAGERQDTTTDIVHTKESRSMKRQAT